MSETKQPKAPFRFHLPAGVLARVESRYFVDYVCALCREAGKPIFGVHFPLKDGQPDLDRLSLLSDLVPAEPALLLGPRPQGRPGPDLVMCFSEQRTDPRPATFCEQCYGEVKRVMQETGGIPLTEGGDQ
jgi:hypothetical protein